jgi:hypothetical protein
MLKSDSLILLIKSMSKSEKKAFISRTGRSSFKPDYLFLYNLIIKQKNITATSLRLLFLEKHPKGSYDTAVKYLYKTLLDVLLELREEQDSYYNLFNKILKARVLFEKSLYEECFSLLHKIIAEAQKAENYFALYLASRIELDYLLTLNLPEITEKTLLNKHFKINETIRIIQKTNQQSSLYEMLKHRLIYKGKVRTEKQKTELNDLVVSEMSLSASSNLENFEINKLHQLFQANYLITVGDNKSAVRSFHELNTLFENNTSLRANPPIYYLQNLEGVLESLRSIKKYDKMSYFVNQLKKIDSPFTDFRANVTCLIYLFELLPKLDQGDFSSCGPIMSQYFNTLNEKVHLLSLQRRVEFCLYSALVFFGIREYHKAHKLLNQIILLGNKYFNLPLYRTVRLVNLMVLYELHEFDLIKYETRSMKRDMHEFEKGYKIERCMLIFVNKKDMLVSAKKREEIWEKMETELELIRNDVYEQQVIRTFNFAAWIESKIRKIPLSEILQSENQRAL